MNNERNFAQQAQVLEFRPRVADLEKTIHMLAAQKDAPALGSHAQDRMYERGITLPDIVRALRIGSIKGGVEAGRNAGEWKCKVVAMQNTVQMLGVITIVINDSKLFIKTVEWED